MTRSDDAAARSEVEWAKVKVKAAFNLKCELLAVYMAPREARVGLGAG